MFIVEFILKTIILFTVVVVGFLFAIIGFLSSMVKLIIAVFYGLFVFFTQALDDAVNLVRGKNGK